MRLTIVKCVFTIIFFAQWSLLSTAHNVHFAIETYVNKSLQPLCEDDVSLNFSNAVISDIRQNFISSPIITCLNLMDIKIKKIERGAFDKLQNLAQLFLSNNLLTKSELFNFGSLDKLQVLIMNSVTGITDYCSHANSIPQIFGEYPNLEILSLRNNCFRDLQFVPKKTLFSTSHYPTTSIGSTAQKVPFPKLKILDLSKNGMTTTNFVTLLSNSLLFLDLHDNLLNTLNLNDKGNKLYALNLNNNSFRNICYSHSWYNLCLFVTHLKDLHYLTVSGNRIEHIEPGAFQDNNYLIYLNLSANSIKNFNSKAFANLQLLKTLDLSNNVLNSVPEILNEVEISTLYINHNRITEIIPNTFARMSKLIKLLMGDNQINKIDVNAFAHLSVLEELDLSTNMLSFLPEGWAKPLESLKYLDLSNNKFTSLEYLSLTNTLPVIKMSFVMNPLENLNVRYFKNLPQNLIIDLINYMDTTLNTEYQTPEYDN